MRKVRHVQMMAACVEASRLNLKEVTGSSTGWACPHQIQSADLFKGYIPE